MNTKVMQQEAGHEANGVGEAGASGRRGLRCWPWTHSRGAGLKPALPRRIGVVACLVALGALAAPAIGVGETPVEPRAIITVRPADNGQPLVNPGMGWTMHFYSNIPENYGAKLEPSDTLEDFPGLSTVYLRVPWAFLEPEEGRFNWALLDTPAQRWIARGKRVAFRLTCSENWLPFATPEWVKKAGAKGTFYEFGKGPSEKGGTWDPDFGDALFLEKLDHFLEAMALRYDGNPDVAFIDIGSYGMWGEGHTFMSSRVPKERGLDILKQHIDLHKKHFKRTLLCVSDDIAGHDTPGAHLPATDYALSQGVTLRDDSILVQPPPRSWYHAEMAQAFWPRFPVILEHEHYGGSKERGAWGDGSLLLKAVEDYHASYMSIHWWPRVELEENRTLIERINRRLGYRLQLLEMSWPKEVAIGRPFTVQSVWANGGVAPCYPGGFPALTLKDAKGGIVSVLSDERFDVRDLRPGPSAESVGMGAGTRPQTRTNEVEFTVGRVAPATRPGVCTVFMSVGRRDGTPVMALPLADDDGQHRYRLGEIELKPKMGTP